MDWKKTIMVVDDNADILTVVRSILEKRGYEVQCAADGMEVFARLEEKKPDLIILDVILPQMDGFEVLKRLKEDPETSDIPVIVLTARGQYRDVLQAYELGTDYYISKPFTGSQLLNGVRLMLESEAA